MELYIECPQCGYMVEIMQINCGIFRHGVFKSNNKQLNPHSPKDICDQVSNDELIYGCGKPFKLENVNGTYIATKCDYI